jgi:hypothetical protein
MTTLSLLSLITGVNVDSDDRFYVVQDGVPKAIVISEMGQALLATALFAQASHTHNVGDLNSFAANVYAAALPQHSAQTTSFTLGLGHVGQRTPLDNTTDQTVTIPANATTAIPVGSFFTFQDIGNGGRWTFAPAGGVTLNPQPNVVGNPKTVGRYSYVILMKTATDTWDYVGNIATRINRSFPIAVFAPAGTVTTGNSSAVFIVPSSLNGYDLVSAKAFLVTVSASGTPVNVQLHNITDSVDMLSTPITIDNTEVSSVTAATPVVIDTAHDDVATNDMIGIDIDAAGSGATGLIIVLEFG